MTAPTDLPPQRALYLLNPAPTVLTPAQLDAMDADEGVAPGIIERKEAR